MSFGATTRKGFSRPFDEVCACDYRKGDLICICARTKEQAKDRCTSCQDGKHKLVEEELPE